MIEARSGAERRRNNEYLEKLQCSSGVPIIVKSVPLRSVGTGKCPETNKWKTLCRRYTEQCGLYLLGRTEIGMNIGAERNGKLMDTLPIAYCLWA